jgi:4-carboxymuconolactone decarboxylase
MNRLPIVDPAKATQEQKAALIEWRVDRRVINLPGGLWGMLVTAPEGMRRVGKLGAFARTRTTLPDQAREAATFLTVCLTGYQLEIDIHGRALAGLGVDQAVVDALRAGRTDGLPEGIRQAARFAQEQAGGQPVGDETFEAARAAFGDRGVVELAIVVGYYLMLSTLARTFVVEDGAAGAASAPAAAGRSA